MTREDRILAQLNELAEESRSPLAIERDYPGIDPEIASLLPIHSQLKQLPRDIALPSTAKARLRAQLMAEFRETMVEREAGPWYRRALQRFTGALTPTSVAQALSRPAAFAAALEKAGWI